MLIQGGMSPRTTTRVDVPQPAAARPCRAPPPEEFLSFDEEVVFEWSKSIPPEVDERKFVRRRAGDGSCRSANSHRPGLFSEVIGESLWQSSTSGSPVSSLLMTPTARSECASAYSAPAASRIDWAQVTVGDRWASSKRCQTAPPRTDVEGDMELEFDATSVVDVVTEHEMRTRQRSKSCRLYGDQGRGFRDDAQSKSARKVRKPNEERYLQHKYRERPCSRAESFVNEELFDSTSDLSRECCDVLGPRHCYDCSRITQRNDSACRNRSEFPSIHTNPKTISTIALVQRLFPELTTLDILEGVADGYISARSFSKDRLIEMVERKKAEARKREIKAKWKEAVKRRISAFSVPDKMYFFSNFTDLRAQLLAQRGSYTGFKGTLFPLSGQQQALPPSEVELVIRKEEDRENPANYFCPPIMTREEIQRQKSQPRFYAGSDQEYKLPDAPPLTEILHKTNMALRDMSSKSVLPKAANKALKPSSPLADGMQASNRHRKSSLELTPGGGGGGSGIFKKVPSRPQPSKLARSELGGGFARKSLAKSSFSRPLQMETLDEDRSQSEKEDVMEEEEEEEEDQEANEAEIENAGEEEAEDAGEEMNSVGKPRHHQIARRAKSSPLLEEEDEEEDEEEGEDESEEEVEEMQGMEVEAIEEEEEEEEEEGLNDY